MTDIVEKLKDACVIDRHYGKSVTLTLDYDDYMEAADTITTLRAENEKLRAALEDIAYPNPDHGEDQLMQIARAALEGK